MKACGWGGGSVPLSFVWPPRLTQQRRATDQTTPTTRRHPHAGRRVRCVVSLGLQPMPLAKGNRAKSIQSARGRRPGRVLLLAKAQGGLLPLFLVRPPCVPHPTCVSPSPSLSPPMYRDRPLQPPARPPKSPRAQDGRQHHASSANTKQPQPQPPTPPPSPPRYVSPHHTPLTTMP